jgi:hypothetical protein
MRTTDRSFKIALFSLSFIASFATIFAVTAPRAAVASDVVLRLQITPSSSI